MTEKELQGMIVNYLSPWFNIEQEVWSGDHKCRIDMAMIHKSDIKKEYPIGIEIKTFDKKTGSDAGRWLFQSKSYTESSFIGYGKMLIVVAPQFSENVFSEGKLMDKHVFNGDPSQDHNVSTFLGQFKLGEFQRYNGRDGWYLVRMARIVFKGLIIWDQKRDIFRPKNITLRCKQ